MGAVWRAEDELLGRQVAVKKLRVPPNLHDDERERLYERTRREARSAARITHPNVVVVHDVCEDEGLPCIVMEYVPARTLGDVLKEDGPVTPREAARIGRGMVAALRAAHRAGVLHRDVKPANVLLTGDGADEDGGWPGGRVVLTDFGIASATGTSTLTRTGELIGSFDYLAPERITGGTPGPASDLWALGATLYQAVEGEAPFHRDTPIETAYAIAADPAPRPRRAGALAPLIESLLAKDPEQRMSAEEVERLLVASVETVTAAAKPRDTATARLGTWRPPAAAAPSAAAPTVSGWAEQAAPQPSGALVNGHPAPVNGHPAPVAEPPPADAPTGSTVPVAPGPGAVATAPAPPGHPGAPGLADPTATTPTAVPGHAAGHAARPRRRGLRVAAWCATAVVVVAAAVVGTLLTREGGKASADGRDTIAPQPSGAGRPTRPASDVPVAPPGYRIAHDPAGFSMAVPKGWPRTVKSNGDVDYLNVAEHCELMVSTEDFAWPSPIDHWRQLEKNLRAKNNGYSLLRMNPTQVTFGGTTMPAAIWEWTWQGDEVLPDGRHRVYHAIDLGFGKEGGTEYALYLSAPDAEWSKWLPVFTAARTTFRPAR
nr:serine/threonine-protein kinase [Streptomyces sp. SID5468]